MCREAFNKGPGVMDRSNDPRSLKLALHRAWERIREQWFSHEGKQSATGEEVRDVLLRWLAQDRRPSPTLLRLWHPLSEEEKKAALLLAFPDKQYSAGEGEEAEAEVEDVKDRLRAHDAIFEQILALIQDKRRLSPEEKQRAQKLLKLLKANLEEDCKEEGRRGDKMTDCERRFYYPAVRKALANIRVRSNTDPIKSNWHAELSGARMDITHPLFKLEHRKKPDQPS
jgi:hypothetical protein